MKRIVLSLVLVLASLACYAQDIVVMTNGESKKVKVEEITDSQIKYRLFDNLSGPLYVVSKNEVFAITYSNGTTETYNKKAIAATTNVDSNYNRTVKVLDNEMESRLRRLRVWSKITKIYGWVNVGLGALFIAAGSSAEEYDPYYDDMDYKAFYTTLGILSLAEGAACVAVGYHLQNKRNKLLNEINYIGSVPVIQKEFQIGNCSVAPSINLMSYRNNPADGIGAGVNIKF